MKRTSFLIYFLILLVCGTLAQTIRITQPDDRATFQPGQAIPIQWQSSGISSYFTLALVSTDQQVRIIINKRVPVTTNKISYTIPSSIAPGRYYVVVGSSQTAVMSACFSIQKSQSQVFNRATIKRQAAPVQPKPDLIVDYVEVSDRSQPYNEIHNRDEIHFLVTVKNIGNASSTEDFYVGFSHWGCNTETWKWQEINMGALDPGKTVLKIIEVRGHDLPNGWGANPDLCVKVDVRNQVTEIRESNNTKSIRLNVVAD